METLYPNGYGSTLVTMRRLRELHEPGMHPDFAVPLFAWIESMGGEVGIGGGWRATQPDRPGFAPDGRSFHQWQIFVSKIRAYAAVDLVRRNPTPGGPHLTMRWSDSATMPVYGLHTFITGEPWHAQNHNIRGWQAWVNQGRPDPTYKLPSPIPPPKPPPEQGAPVMTSSTVWLNPSIRILDSRWWDEGGRFGADIPGDTGVRQIPCAQAAGKSAVTVTVTAVAPKAGGFVTLWRSGLTPPIASCVNYAPGQTVANTTSVPVAADGSFHVYAYANTHMVIDLVGVHS